MDAPVVEPNENAPEAAPEVTPEQPQAPQAPPSLPPEVLKNPAIQGLLAGMPVAVSDQIKAFDKKPVGKLIIENKDALQAAGMGFYRSLSGDTGVLFNQLHIHPEDLLAADKAGKLTQLAPDLDKISHELGKAGKNHPILSAQGAPGAPAAPTPMAAPQSAQLPPQPSPAAAGDANRKLTQARVMAMTPGAPTSGPAPGQGRLLNSILKPVV